MEAAKKPTPIAISTTSSMAITHEFILFSGVPNGGEPESGLAGAHQVHPDALRIGICGTTT